MEAEGIQNFISWIQLEHAIATLEKIKHFDGLYGDLNHTRRNDYFFLEMIQTRSKHFDWIIETHIHSYLYQLFFITAGTVAMEGAIKFQRLHTPCIVMIPPNTLHGLRYSADVQGKILTVSDALVEYVFADAPAILVDMEKINYLMFSTQQDPVYQKIAYMLEQIEEELFANKPQKKKFLDASITHLFTTLWRLIPANAYKSGSDTNTTLTYYKGFQQAVRKTATGKTIAAYAKEIGISTVHLNRVCKQVAGKSAILLVQEETIEKAKNYLTHSSYTIAEIAYQLHFQYPNYFARLFKKMTGISPTDYRIHSRGVTAENR